MQDFYIITETTGIFHFVLLCRILLIIAIIDACHPVYLARTTMEVGEWYKIALIYILRNQGVHCCQKYSISGKHNGNTCILHFTSLVWMYVYLKSRTRFLLISVNIIHTTERYCIFSHTVQRFCLALMLLSGDWTQIWRDASNLLLNTYKIPLIFNTMMDTL